MAHAVGLRVGPKHTQGCSVADQTKQIKTKRDTKIIRYTRYKNVRPEPTKQNIHNRTLTL